MTTMTKNVNHKNPYRDMNMLAHGGESCERFELLLGLTSIKSEQVIKATRAYLVHGYNEETIEFTYDVSQLK